MFRQLPRHAGNIRFDSAEDTACSTSLECCCRNAVVAVEIVGPLPGPAEQTVLATLRRARSPLLSMRPPLTAVLPLIDRSGDATYRLTARPPARSRSGLRVLAWSNPARSSSDAVIV